ncbi:hypothetical protein JTE90_005741 [Oedothorax gibbosus]|uniref:Voltage-gated hydrogen channel 1 n=1 Tax=Oedothorax gibbosus TaxID=931172 RepID=A0AAV6UR81_9ARAC|nr:hypothetical protein JTE90_005741 [Oedothorax gibbosus]
MMKATMQARAQCCILFSCFCSRKLVRQVGMEKSNEIHLGVESSNTNNGSSFSITTDTEEDPSIRPLMSFREKLCKLFESHKFQLAIIALVLVDCLIVIAELILEAKHHELSDKTLPHALHIMSIAILSVFVVEILMKIYAFRMEFFHHKFEIFDALVVFLSFALDIYFWEQEGIDLIIVLRLWRVARILNGVVMSVKTAADNKLHKEKRLREGLEQELTKCRTYATGLEQEVESLHSLLKKHGITEIPPSVVDKSQMGVTISVVAEVNKTAPESD